MRRVSVSVMVTRLIGTWTCSFGTTFVVVKLNAVGWYEDWNVFPQTFTVVMG